MVESSVAFGSIALHTGVSCQFPYSKILLRIANHCSEANKNCIGKYIFSIPRFLKLNLTDNAAWVSLKCYEPNALVANYAMLTIIYTLQIDFQTTVFSQ
jgi:hypothetical protein